jgi:hypothetical protein
MILTVPKIEEINFRKLLLGLGNFYRKSCGNSPHGFHNLLLAKWQFAGNLGLPSPG